LFSKKQKISDIGNREKGVRSRKHVGDRIIEHERSTEHLDNYLIWKERHRNTSDKTAIEDYCEKSIMTEAGKWRKILTSIAEIIMFCAKNNIAFRGNMEELDQRDNGVFLSTFELLANHDSILQETY
jgi:hypothetical protein